MLSGQPYSRLIAASLCAAATAVMAWACGGSTSTNVVGPDNPRCQTSVTGQPTSLPYTGGQVTVTVTAARDCTWEASSDAAWMQLSSTSGQGDATITATAAANDRGNSRTATVAVNDQRLAVLQEPRPCSFELRAEPSQISSAGGRGSIRVATDAGCAWTATSSTSWLRLLTPSGTGSGEATFEASANGGGPRDATIMVSGHPVLISQTGAGGDPGPPGPNCTATVGPATISAPAGGGPQTVTLAIAAPCEWTAASAGEWVTVEPPAGRGPATLTLQVAANGGGARSATITVAGGTVTVNQAAVPPCTYSIDSSSRNFPAGGGDGSVRVTTQGHCTWSASGAPEWISISTAPRTGGGEIGYTVQRNTSTSSRSATLTIAGRSYRVTQEAAAPTCTYRVEPASAGIGAGGGNGTFNVVTEQGCAWTAGSDQGWAIVNTPSGSGPGQVSYRVDANGSTSERSARITVNGQTHTITQAGATPTCSYRVDPASASMGPGGGAGAFNVITEQGCSWTANSNQPWAIVNTPGGSGSGSVSYRLDANGSPSERSAQITVNGQTHTVTQAAAAPTCTYRVDPASSAIGSGGGPGMFNVVTEQGCAWTAASDQGWATVNTPGGAGPGQVSYSVAANGSTSERSARITVNGQTHIVTQAAAAPTCTYRLDPAGASIGAGGGAGAFNVVTEQGCAWTAASDQGWTVVNTPGGAGPGQVSYSVDANGSTSERSARITVNGQTHTVTQAAAAPACTYQVDPASASIGFGGGPGTFNVITQPGCAWTAASDQGWTAVNTPGGTGPGAVSYSVEANGTATERSARITVNGQTHTVTQAAAVAQLCEYRVQPGSASYGASGGNGAFNVITDDGCAWRAASAAQWTVVNTAEGSGPSQVTYRVEANSAPSGRATVIAVNGRLHFVLQGGASDDDDAAAMLNARLPGPPTDRRYCPSCSDQHSSYSR